MINLHIIGKYTLIKIIVIATICGFVCIQAWQSVFLMLDVLGLTLFS